MRYWLLLIAYGLIAVHCEAQSLPFVFGVENTGFHLDKPVMPAPDQLPVVRELPDALEGVSSFSDCLFCLLVFSKVNFIGVINDG